jgi:predicted kinase
MAVECMGVQPSCPLMILMKGHPGTGKSSIAKELSKRTGWALIDKDDARDSLDVLSDLAEQVDLNGLSYRIMWKVTETQLECGNSVIVDCPLARVDLYRQAKVFAEKVRHMACKLE